MRRAAPLLCLALVTACAQGQSIITVEISADPDIAGELSKVKLWVTASKSLEGTEEGDFCLPKEKDIDVDDLPYSIDYIRGETYGAVFALRLEASTGENDIAFETRRIWQEGEDRLLKVRIESACFDRACEDPLICVDEECLEPLTTPDFEALRVEGSGDFCVPE